MKRSIVNLLIVSLVLVQTSSGCAAQLKETRGIARLGYTIQVGAFSSVRNAERLTVQLQHKGIEAFYFRKENGLYAVRFGDYPTWDAANQSAGRLAAQKVIGAYFIADPQTAYLKRAKEPELRQNGGEPARAKAASGMGELAARTAERFIGITYRWGGNTVAEGLDCSGFVRAVYNLCGVSIPRTSREQFKVGEKVGRGELKEGDLVFFGDSAAEISHVGIYAGGHRFVHAPKRGDNIKKSALGDSYYQKRYQGARRYF
jgi:cell wall-associated NlpC family hydrolase